MKKFKLLFAAFLLFLLPRPALARPSDEWQRALDERTALMWVDGQVFEEFVLNARARLTITWLPVALQRRLDKDTQVDGWVVDGLHYYFSLDKDTRQRMKGRDVLALGYKTQKNWNFDLSDLTVGGYRVTEDDVLGHPDLRDPTGQLPPGEEGLVYIRVPSLKPGTTVRISLGPDSVDLKLPKR